MGHCSASLNSNNFSLLQHQRAAYIACDDVMLIQHLPLLNQHRIVLASASPRRLELLRQIGVNVEVQASTFEEDLDKRKYTPAGYAQATAREKAEDVARRTQGDAIRPLLIVAADTVADCNTC